MSEAIASPMSNLFAIIFMFAIIFWKNPDG
jgi:hypothetical protein